MKQILFYLIRLFHEKKITPEVFCNELYLIYDINHNEIELSDYERENLEKLSVRASRFTDNENDLVHHKGVYFTAEQLYKITEEVFIELNIKNKTPYY